MTIITQKLNNVAKGGLYEILHFNSLNKDPSEFLDYALPYPLTLQSFGKEAERGYGISWAVDGYSLATNTREYKSDIISKISVILNAEQVKHLPIIEKADHFNPQIYNYKDFPLSEINIRSFNNFKDEILHNHGKDAVFEEARYDIYAMKRYGTLSYDLVYAKLLEVNEKNGLKKSESDIRSKAKNMFAWTRDFYNAGSSWTREKAKDYHREYYQKQRGEGVATIKEANIAIGKAKIKASKETIKTAMDIMKKTGQKVTIMNIVAITNLDKMTVSKYYKEYK